MKYVLKEGFKSSHLCCMNNIVTNINAEFTKLTEYTKEEIIGKSLTEVSRLLRIDSQVCLEDIDSEYSCYMFTKEYKPREVTITCKLQLYGNEKVYFLKEKPNSRVEDKAMYFEQLYKDNQNGATIFSFPDLILLMANDKHLESWYPYKSKETAIGRRLKELVIGKEWSEVESHFLKVINSGRSHYCKELKYECAYRGTKYYDTSLVPIYIKGKIKYLVQIFTDATERVVNRKITEEKNKQLEVILQNLSDGIFICDKEGKSIIEYNEITELHNKVKNIKEKKDELEAIINSMYDGVCVIDKDFNITTLNSSLRGLVLDGNNFGGTGCFQNTTKFNDLEGNLIKHDETLVRRAFRGEKIQDFRLDAHRPDGVYHLSINGSPIYDNSGNILKVIVSVRNITEQVKKDEIIKKQNDMLNAIIENMSDELVIVDNNGQLMMTNKAVRKRYSIGDSVPLTLEAIFNKFKCYDNDGNLMPFESLPARRVVRGEKFSPCRIDYKDEEGCVFNYESSGTPIYDSEGNLIAGVLINRSISDRLKNEENKLIKAQYDILSKTIENLDLIFAVVSYPNAEIKYINRNTFNQLKEINQQVESIDSCIGKNIFEILKLSKRGIALMSIKIKQLMNNKYSHIIFTRKFLVDRKELYLKIICQPLYNYNSGVTDVVVIGIDITKEIEARIKMEQALKLQDEIFTNIAHELKTPLNVIYSTIQLMEIYWQSGSIEANKEKIHNDINIIKQNCYRFIKLINNIVDTSKIESGFLKLSLTNENIVEVIENIVQSVSEFVKEKGINIVFDTDTEEKIIACDPNKIERIMLNLISNAVKFSDTYKIDNNIYVEVSDKNDTVEISVRDTGIGIEKKYLHKIFKRFYQVDKSLSRNAEGCGIGLSLVKSFVEMHGGKIRVNSKAGKGTIFKIELPAVTIAEDEIACDKIIPIDNKVEMISIEFSDIYSWLRC